MENYSEDSLEKKIYHFSCKKCNKIPTLQIVDRFNYNVHCLCHDKILDIKALKENFFEQYGKYEEGDVFTCPEHEKQYKEYCQICNKNLCESCVCTHPKQNLDNRNIEDPINFLKNLFWPDLKEKNIAIPVSSDEVENIKDNESILKFVVSIIINDYRRGKNENLSACIINLYNFFSKNQFPAINSPNVLEKLKKLNNDDLKKITKIDIYQYCFDLKILNSKLQNLNELSLRNCNIYDLNFLIKGDFPNLEKLILDNNKINDKVLEDINNFNCKNLKELSLKQNYICNYRIFQDIEKNFESLIKLDISSNKLKNKDFFKQEIKINLNSIEELIISNGIFDNNSIENISKISLNNLNIIDLSSNSLETLKFINNISWPKIKKIILNNNDISDIKELEKFKNIYTKNDLFIIIENNLIKDEKQIDNLINVTSEKNNIKIKYQLCSELTKNDENDRHNEGINTFAY
jgi:hypothetical protein